MQLLTHIKGSVQADLNFRIEIFKNVSIRGRSAVAVCAEGFVGRCESDDLPVTCCEIYDT